MVFKLPKKYLILLVVALLLLGGFCYLFSIFFGNPIRGSKMVFSFLEDPEENLVFSDGRTNVLLLGIGGQQQNGADLTDTIIFTSIDIKTGDMAMVSIPRDIWLDSLQAKVNTAYHYGEEREEGGGFVLAREAVSEIVGLPIHYVFLMDFNAFEDAIDLVGGVEVEIERSFDDFKYPISGEEEDDCDGDPEYSCRYEHLHFEAGFSEMDGAVALKFVRSRNAEGEEGTDFARSQRQQKIIHALKDKIVSARILANPGKIKELIEVANKNVTSNPLLKDEEAASFGNILLSFIRSKSQIRTLSLDIGTDENPGFLENPQAFEKYQNQWVLVPRSSDFRQFQQYFIQKIENGY